MTVDLKCDEDYDCGRVTCDALLNRAMGDAEEAKTEFELVLKSAPTERGAERAEAAKALHDKSLRAINLVVQRREETCEPIDFENL